MKQASAADVQKTIAPMLAGVFGGGISTVALYPLDLIKVRLAVNEESARNAAEFAGSQAPSRQLNSFQVVRTILKHEGIPGLYAGLTPAVVGSSVSWGGYLFIYENIKRRYAYWRYPEEEDWRFSLSPVDNFGLACISGACLVLITNPIWLIKTRMQLQLMKATSSIEHSKEPYKGMLDAAKTIIREEGVRSLYRGTGTALLQTSHGGVQFTVYEFLRKNIRLDVKKKREKNISLAARVQQSAGYLTMGAVSKIIASSVTYPLQVIKARLQQRSETLELTSSGDVKVVKREYSGILKTISRIYTKEGVGGFFKGVIPNALRVAPGAAITFVVYETVLDMVDYS